MYTQVNSTMKLHEAFVEEQSGYLHFVENLHQFADRIVAKVGNTEQVKTQITDKVAAVDAKVGEMDGKLTAELAEMKRMLEQLVKANGA